MLRRQRIADLPVRRKLLLIVMLASGGALLAANAGLFLADYFRFRRELVRDLQSLAEVIAENCTAALSFDDPRAAAETLAALGAKRPVVAAAVYRADGRRFAEYHRVPPGAKAEPGAKPAPAPPPPPQLAMPLRPPPDGEHFSAGRLDLVRPVRLRGQRIGTVYLAADLSEMYSRLRQQAATVTIVLLASAAISLLVSSRLQRVISEPILRLAETAETVSRSRDYATRAERHSGDELGLLVDAFNQMLSQIEDRDRELQQAREQLEQRVAERTLQLEQELAERQRAERELAERNVLLDRSNRELDDFAYIASHDLKEPLRGIHNYSQFLLEDYERLLDADGRSKLETLVRLSRRMEALIDSLLHFSRVGRMDLALDRVDLNPVVAEALDSLAVPLAESGVEVRLPRPLPEVRCDRQRAVELFQNLLGNAIKYNDKPAGRWVEVGFLDGQAGDGPVLYVRDNGIGIPDRHLDVVFRIFKRLHGRDQFGGGTGAGLTIVKKIVDRHQGRIWVESTLGEGTAFYFTLGGGSEA
jgi:signal transduction histidine kinase